MGKLTIDLEKQGDTDVFRLGGMIDEDAADELARIAQVAGPKVVFNFRDIKMVNSAGTRAWVLFLKPFAPGREVAFESCPPPVVEQVNMVPAFAAGARLKSVYAPFACVECNHETTVLLTEDKYPADPDELVADKCAKCGATSEFAGGQEYFVFVEG